jgi:hypothetical protein
MDKKYKRYKRRKTYRAVLIDKNGFEKKTYISRILPVMYLVDKEEPEAVYARETTAIPIPPILHRERVFYLDKNSGTNKQLIYRELLNN